MSTNLRVWLALLACYIIWGSTYLCIRYCLETIPPFMIGGIRWTLAGLILFSLGKKISKEPLTAAHWKTAALVGFLLLFIGNGVVILAEQYIPSGLTAVIISSSPVFMIGLEWMRPGGNKPSKREVTGIIIGLFAIVILFSDDIAIEHNIYSYLAVFGIFVGIFSWSFGSVYSRTADHPKTSILYVGMQMLISGVMFIIASAVAGEFKTDFSNISAVSSGALLYLVIFGSIIAYSSYIWLLKNTTVARVSTPTYVNPIVALFLGWIFAGELLTYRIAGASFIIVFSVILINLSKQAAKSKSPAVHGSKTV